MSLIDIKAVREEANKEFAKEQSEAAKTKLKSQMRVVEQAKRLLRAEELKLADLEQQILDGTL